jgi:hypothetical protein
MDESSWDERLWCEQYPRRIENAPSPRVRAVLVQVMTDLRAGLTLKAAADRHHLPPLGPDLATRSEVPAVLAAAGGGRPIPVPRRYWCPREVPCGRSGESDPLTGAEPFCAVADRSMNLG